MKVLVCGGRDYDRYRELWDVLDDLHERVSMTHLIHGSARGADSLAGAWAQGRGVQEVSCPANWAAHQNSAGYLRNSSMLGLGPDLVVAFPGGKGTAMMVKMAREAGVEVMEV